MLWWTLALALAQEPDPVARGWYLWSTGQDEAAWAAADALAAEGSVRGEALPFVMAMGVERGDGATQEAEARHQWAQHPDEPWGRTALAWAVALRHATEGPWCDEVTVLTDKVADDAVVYWAALASRQRAVRCDGTSDHGDAQLRRLARDGLGSQADATLGTLKAGYYKTGFQDDVEALWAEAPHHLRDAGAAWGDGVGGPAKMAVRNATKKALDAAAESGTPSLVHAAMLGYRGAGKDKDAAAAEARLKALDPAADTGVERSLDDVADPSLYATIGACVTDARVVAEALRCLRKLTVPETGAQAAAYHAALRDVFDVDGDADQAYVAARDAYQADPRHRFHARVFADRAIARGSDGPLARAAAERVLEGSWPVDPATVDAATGRVLGTDLLRLARAERLAGDPAAAVDHLEAAVRLSDAPALAYQLGLALGEAEQTDAAVLVLVHALATPLDDTRLVTEARSMVDDLLGDWHPGGLKGALAEAARPLGDDAPAHPLVGRPLPEGVLPEVEAEADAEPPAARIVLVTAPWSEATEGAIDRVAAITERYAARGVQSVVLSVGRATAVAAPPADGEGEATVQGLVGVDAATLRALRLVAVPSVVVVGARDRIEGVVVGYDPGTIAIEDVLDGFLPPEPPSDDAE